jgi:hypothetical protein
MYVYVNLPLGAESPLSMKLSGSDVYKESAENHLNSKLIVGYQILSDR